MASPQLLTFTTTFTIPSAAFKAVEEVAPDIKLFGIHSDNVKPLLDLTVDVVRSAVSVMENVRRVSSIQF